VSHLVPDRIKEQTSAKFNSRLWKMIEYHRHPSPGILLGDSRMRALQAAYVGEVSGARYDNLSFGAASMKEVLATFWFADSTTRLKDVYIGVGLSQMNAGSTFDQTGDYRAMTRNPCRYFVSRLVAQGIASNLYFALTGRPAEIGKPVLSREAFWKFQLTQTARESYGRFQYSDAYMAGLRQVAERCRNRGIHLAFVILPSHADLQTRVAAYGLTGVEQRFKRDLAALAPVFDFDTRNDITTDRGNFGDPYHFHEPVMRRIVREVWGAPGRPPGAATAGRRALQEPAADGR
jgi:hypothetical protein